MMRVLPEWRTSASVAAAAGAGSVKGDREVEEGTKTTKRDDSRRTAVPGRCLGNCTMRNGKVRGGSSTV